MTRAQKSRQRASEGPEEANSNDAPTRMNDQSAEAIEDACCVLNQIDEVVAEAEEVDSDPEPSWETYLHAVGAPPEEAGDEAWNQWVTNHPDEFHASYAEWRRALSAWRIRNGVADLCGCR